MANSVFPPRLTIDRGSVLRLFTGDTFYSSSDASLREAILNAIDSTARLRESQPVIAPNMLVEFDRTTTTITISDNGIGMTESDLSDLFAKVGSSASRSYSADPTNRQKMIGEFGIGVMSYFLVCEEFDVQTKTDQSAAIGLRFSAGMIDDDIPALELSPERTDRGTTIVFRVKDLSTFELLLQKFPYWARNVEGLKGILADTGSEVAQGGLSREVFPVEAEYPDWIFRCTLGPPKNLEAWHTFDGRAHIDVLYSGVFVERVEIEQLWCIEGSVFVDPKKFRPKLNREGFVGPGLKEALDPFLRQLHPAALATAADILSDVLQESETRSWAVNRLAALWLAVPRAEAYAEAVRKWDAHFRRQPLIRQLLANEKETFVSVDDLVERKYEKLYTVPTNWGNHGQMERAAVRLLRDEGKVVLVGIERDSSYLAHASFAYASTETILAGQFASELPPLIPVFSVRDEILRQESIVDVALRPIVVRIVNVGPDAGGILVAGSEIWINGSVDAGRAIARHLCDNPFGWSSLIGVCLKYAPDQIAQVAALCRGHDEQSFMLGPVRRQVIRLKLL